MPSSNSNNSNNFQHQNQNQNIVDQTISTLINAVNSLRSNTALPSAQPPPPPAPAPPSVNTYLRNSFPTVAGWKKNRKRVRVLQSPNSYFIQTAKCRGISSIKLFDCRVNFCSRRIYFFLVCLHCILHGSHLPFTMKTLKSH